MKGAWVIAGALALAPGAAFAADWVSVGKSTTGTEALVDAQSIAQSGTATRVWVKFVYSKPQASGASSTSQLYALHCVAREYRVVSFADYASDGNVVRSGRGMEQLEPIIPESMAEAVHGAVCPRS